MATARIAAGLVKAAADTKRGQVEYAVKQWRAAQVANVKAEPKIEGPFWRRTITHLTQEQAETEYDRLVGILATRQYWDDRYYRPRGIDRANHLAALATAALTSGDGYVTLDADEVRFLGLEAVQ